MSRNDYKTTRKFGIALIVLGVIWLVALIMWTKDAGANPPPPNPNQVEYWCPTGGIKIEPVDTPFVVPAPPAGFTWTLLVLKAGDENSTPIVNETFPSPVVGQAYSRTDGKNISHVILCHAVTTTVPNGDTTIPTTTPTTLPTTVPTTLPTTVPTTLPTTVPTTIATTTTGNVGVCCLEGTTVVTTVPTTVATTVPVTTVPPTTAAPTTAPAVTTIVAAVPVSTELPVTGFPALLVALAGIAMIAIGVPLLRVDR